MNRRSLLALPALLSLCRAALAADWPSRPMRVLVPFSPGGSTDFIARMVAVGLGEALGVTVVVENRGGAGGTSGSEVIAKSAPDGTNFLVSNIASHGVAPSIYRNLPYDPVTDFIHLGLIAEIPSVLAINARCPERTLAEFIATARRDPQFWHIGSPGNGSSSHVKQELFKRLAGIELTHVPYRGSGPALTDTVAGHIEGLITTLVEAGQNDALRLLAVTSAARVPGWPAVPTFAESGFPALVATTWFGISAPAGLPAPIADRMNAEIIATVRHPDVAPLLVETAATPRCLSRQEYTAFIVAEIARWAEVVRASGARID